ncbi:MAG: LytTR family DNA-binding domain-containing protein [Bacteroidota bacterium]
MKVVIIEDEPLAVERLINLIHQYESHIKVVASLDSIQSAVEWFHQNETPDLVFMDIQLADGLSFGIFDKVQLKAPIIFITAYDNYAIKAFKMQSVDYLLKPISFEELATAMDKFVKVFWEKKVQSPVKVDLQALKALLTQKEKSYKTRFVVKRGEHIHPIAVSDILFFYSEDKATLFKTRDGQRFFLDYTLNELEDKINPDEFFRVNRQYLCRIDSIEKILTYSQRRIRLYLKHTGDDTEVLVSREKVQKFKAWLDQ